MKKSTPKSSPKAAPKVKAKVVAKAKPRFNATRYEQVKNKVFNLNDVNKNI